MTEAIETISCPNCASPIVGRYCADCGQDNSRKRLVPKAVFADAMQNLVGWDSALAHTLRGLIVDPGKMSIEYVSGRRRRYVNPARFCLLALTGWFLATRLLGMEPLDISGINVTSKEGGAEGAKTVELVRAFLGKHLEVLLYLSLPLRAVILRFFFRSSGRNVAEALVLVLYIAGFTFLLSLIISPLVMLYGAPMHTASKVVGLVWFLRAVKSFYGRNWFQTIWRGVFVSGLHMTASIIFFGVIAFSWVAVTR